MGKFLKSLALFGALIALLFVLYLYRGVVTEVLARFGTGLRNLSRERESDRKILELESELQRLRNERALTETKSALSSEDRYRYKIAEIYSRYPFNDQSIVFINLGSDDGIKEGMPVFIEKGVLLGKVKKVKRTQSEVETIFSALWKTSVAVGSKDVKAVYVGGASPSLDFVPKDAVLTSGERVVSIAPDLPLGTLLGKVSEIDKNSYEVWQRAKVEPLFYPESFSTVLVLVDFP